MSGLSGEDRKRLRGLANQPSVNNAQARAIHSALALIDQQEKALEAADELAKRVLAHDTDDRFTCGYCEKQARAYRSARSTSTKEDGC